jgi:uncharacterized membrane protein
LQFALYWWLLRTKQADPPLTKAVLAPGGAAALTAAVVAVFEHLHSPTRLIMIILVLAAGMFALGAVRPHDLRFLRTVMMLKS